MISGTLVFGTSIAYVILLFILAYISDKNARLGKGKLLRSPLVFTLALSVYCTSWTFYGAVGSAARNGLEFFAIYLGPTLVFIGWWFGLRKLIRIGHKQRITSIADFVSSRFGKSERLAILITIMAVVGITPYIALQLKAISTSLRVILTDSPNAALPQTGDEVGLAFGVAAAMALFSVMFGTRNINANEQHHGVVAAIAFEAIIKFIALIAVGLFVVFGLGGGFEATYARAEDVGVALDASSNFGPRWITITILSAAAIICLPRQFQITVVENANENHLRTASWAFPLYLFGISIFTMPIAIMGLSLLPAGADPDMFVLTLPLAYDQQALALFAFIGGFSSATSMIIIASIALSIMISNHIVVPLALRSPKLFGLKQGQGMTRLLLTSRRVSISAVLFLGFIYFWLTSGSGALAPIGLISFAGVAQFLPAILAALYWRDATVSGALAGLLVGFIFWAYTSFLPSFGTASPFITDLLLYGPWQMEVLRPQVLFGLENMDPLVHSVFWSLLANSLALIVVSFLTQNNTVGQLQAAQFVDVFKQTENSQYSFTRSSAPLNDLLNMTQRVLGTEHAGRLFATYSNSDRIEQNKDASPHFIANLEKELAGSIGAASAHVLLGQVVSGDTVTLEEVMQMADETQQILEYSQRLEQTATELQSTTRQLQAANNQLRQLDQQKDEFLSQVSHEVRTPMTAIRSFSEILLTNKDLDSQQKQSFINTIHEESMRLTSLLDEILDLNALERGEQLWTNEPIDPNKAIARSIQVCTPITEQHQVEVRLGEHIRHVQVEANFDRICQVFINLISNAAKYNNAAKPFVEITSEITKMSDKPDQLTIRFTDNGPGISSAHSNTIFDKFWRGARNPDTAQSGSGLGLAISREILSQMNGSLELDVPKGGKAGMGACFAVRLPVHM